MRKENPGDLSLTGVKDDLSDKEDFQLILKGRYSLGIPRTWRREIWPKDKKGDVV